MWRAHRKLFLPAFKMKALQSYVDILQEKAITAVRCLTAEENKESFNVMKCASTYTLNSAFSTLMGDATVLDDETVEKYIEAGDRLHELNARRIKSLYLYPDFIYNLSQTSKDMNREGAIVSEFAINSIRRSKELMNNVTDNPDNKDVYKTFMDLLIYHTDKSKIFTEQDAKYEFNTMLSGAFDTSVLLISYTMLTLASHPEIQEKLHQELYEIFGDKDPEIYKVTPEHIIQMDYLDRILKETLRIFPVVPYIFRKVTEDFKVGEYTLPKDSILFIPIMKLHHDKVLWQNPQKFDPDRFLPEENAKRHEYSFIPFSAGSRNCIGFKYGIMSVKIFLATVLRKYNLINDSIIPFNKIKLKHEMFLKPVHPIKIRIKKRMGNKQIYKSKSYT